MSYLIDFNESVHKSILKYSNSIVRVAFAYVKNIADAEDIAQDTFLTYLDKKPIFESDEHEKAWLIRVTINKCKNFLKASWFKKRSQLTENLSYLPKEESDILYSVLELDKKYRIPIHLYYYEGYSINEIAKILDTKPSTVGTWLDRGRKILKEKLGGLRYE